MTQATAMLNTYPAQMRIDRKVLARTIETLVDCAQTCTACADACLAEQRVAELVACVRLNLDCADVCETTARSLSRQTGYDAQLTRSLLQTCVQACRSCGAECERYAGMYEHCRVCAEECRRCEQACQELLAAIG